MPEVLIILIAAALPALVLIYYIYRKDKYQREPVRQLLKAFGYGILSVFVVLWIFGPAIAMVTIPEPSTAFGAFWNAFLTAGLPEEVAKLLCLWLFLRKNPYFDEYIDGIVYAVCVGMGFAAFENIGYLFSNADAWREIGLLRAILSIPGHFFFAVTMGYFYSKAVFGDPAKRIWNFALALLVPVLLHGLFDALLMTSDAVGGSASAIMLFGGLWFYMFSISKKRIREHLKNN
ncbi:MAG: PrsW family intramembrane metalloprotease [Bacteroidales bacterium]|nr:PrsW family intramembrane metalloprotease [Bacteroidales bacterium]